MYATAPTEELHTIFDAVRVAWLVRPPVSEGRYRACTVPPEFALYKLGRQPNPVIFNLQPTNIISKERILVAALYGYRMSAFTSTITLSLVVIDCFSRAE